MALSASVYKLGARVSGMGVNRKKSDHARPMLATAHALQRGPLEAPGWCGCCRKTRSKPKADDSASVRGRLLGPSATATTLLEEGGSGCCGGVTGADVRAAYSERPATTQSLARGHWLAFQAVRPRWCDAMCRPSLPCLCVMLCWLVLLALIMVVVWSWADILSIKDSVTDIVGQMRNVTAAIGGEGSDSSSG